jgi:hypothetical protein
MANDETKWKIYEQVVARLEEGFQNCAVVLNNKVIGRRSGLERQVDVLLTGMVGTHEIRVAVECRLYSRKVGIKDIEAFESFVDDVGVDRGVIVGPFGFTEGARRRAERTELTTVTPEEADDFDWSAYWEQEWEDEHHRFYTCRSCGGDVFLEKDQLTGKAGYCRTCGAFHVWCHRCNQVHPYELSTHDKHVFHTVRCSGKTRGGRCRATWTLYFERGLIESMKP